MQKFGKFCLENANSWHFDVEISLAKGIIFRKIGLANGAILKQWAAHPCPKFSREPPPPLVSTKVSRAIGFSKYAKTFLKQETLKTLFTGIVEPHFRYYCSVWGCAGSTVLNQLQKLQNRAARIITNSSFDTPSRPLIDQLGWKTIEQLVASESKAMVFKSLHELAPVADLGGGGRWGQLPPLHDENSALAPPFWQEKRPLS